MPRHFGNTNKAQIQQAMIAKVIEHYDAEWMDELFHQQESLSAMDYGTIAIRVDYDDTLNQLMQTMPVIEDRAQVVFAGYANCLECGHEGVPDNFQKSADQMPRCPNCGDYNVGSMVPPQHVTAPAVVGMQSVSQGDIRIDLLPIPSLNWDMHKLVHQSSWVHQRTAVSKRLVESLLQIKVAANDGTEDFGLRSINEIAHRGSSVAGYGREDLGGHYQSTGNTTIMDECWFRPDHYAGTKLGRDEKTVSGDVIPKGVPLEQIFPDGLCISGFNDMSIVSGVWSEKCRILSTVYHIQSFSGRGKGTTDAIEISEHLNVTHTAAMAAIKRFGAGGGWQYDSDVISQREAQAMLKPGGLVGVKMRGTNYTSIDQVMKKIETGQLDQGNLSMIAALSNMLNVTFQTTDFTAGVADSRVDINTLGGQQLLQAQNQQRSAAPLRMKAYLRARVFEQVMDLFRLHIQLPKYFGTFDKFGLTRGKYISGADIPEHIKCDAVPDSELPTNSLTKRDNFERLLEKTGASGTPFLEVVQASPRVAAWMAEQFQVELPLFNYTEILIVCQNRLDQIKDLAQVQQQAAELSGYAEQPSIVADQIVEQITPPIEPTEDNLDIKAQVLAEYLDDDEVKDWTPYQRAAVQALIWKHHKAQAEFRASLASIEQQGQLALQNQAVQANQAMQAPMLQQQQQDNADAQEQQNNAAMHGELMNRVGSQAEAAMQFSRDQEAADHQHQRDLELEKVRAQGRNKPASSTKGKK